MAEDPPQYQACLVSGHEAENCDKVYSSAVPCRRCKVYGHVAAQCTKPVAMEKCQLCGKSGHSAAQCSDLKVPQVCNKPKHTAAK